MPNLITILQSNASTKFIQSTITERLENFSPQNATILKITKVADVLMYWYSNSMMNSLLFRIHFIIIA